MSALAPAADIHAQPSPDVAPLASAGRGEARWSLAFLGTVLYVLIEYTRLAAMFPVLAGWHIAKIAVGITFLGLLLAPRAQLAARSRSRTVDLLLLAFLATSLVSTLLARDSEFAWTAYGTMARWVVVCFMISRVANSSWRFRFLVFFLLLLNLKLGQFQIRSYFAGSSMSEEVLAEAGAGSIGFFANSNDFGVAMCVVWPLAGVLFFGERKKYVRVFLLVCFLVFGTALLLSGSRGALVGALATALAAFFLTPKKLMGPLMAGVILLGASYLLPSANQKRLQSMVEWEQDTNAKTRINLWKAGIRMFLENPVLGVGPGNFRPTYATYQQGPLDPHRVLAPHSIYVQALSELGLLGGLTVFALLWLGLHLNTQAMRWQFNPALRRQNLLYYQAFALTLALVGFLVSGAFLTVLYYPHLWILLGLSVGLHNFCARQEGPLPDRQPDALPAPQWNVLKPVHAGQSEKNRGCYTALR
ncbi:MAG: O-antigen ligase family protein [Terriglobales bacterium]